MLIEEGLFLALDLGGTNFRVLLLELSNGALIRQEVKRYYIGSELRLGSAVPLFDYLAKCVSDFVIAQGLQDVELPLGKLSSASTEHVKPLINANSIAQSSITRFRQNIMKNIFCLFLVSKILIM